MRIPHCSMKTMRVANLFVRGLACTSIAATASAQVGPWRLSRVSVYQNGTENSLPSFNPTISSNGRLLAFATRGPLLPQDLNNYDDIYLLDTSSGNLELLSVTPGGVAGNQTTAFPVDISNDDRMVAFMSSATDLLPGLSADYHAFVRDRMLGLTRLVSISSSGVEGFCSGQVRISGDGRFAVFPSIGTQLFQPDGNGAADVFVHDLTTGSTELISRSVAGNTGNAASGDLDGGDISFDGRFVVFGSLATDLVSGHAPAFGDVYVRDRSLGTNNVVSVAIAGQTANGGSGRPRCSEDGQIVAFESWASNLVAGDNNAKDDIFVRNLSAGTTTRVSVSSSGTEADNRSTGAVLSPDGRFVAFASQATNLVPGDTNGTWDTFLFDRSTNRLERLSVDNFGAQGAGDSTWVSLSRNAFSVVLQSNAFNLVPNDNNNTWDVFLLRGNHGKGVGYCTAKVNSQGCAPAMSSAGLPTASLPDGFVLRAGQILNQKSGMLIYSSTGPAAIPFAGGTLCVAPQVRRTPGLNSGGSTLGTDCSGSFAFDFNAWVAAGSDPALVIGTSVWAQYWSRDPGFAPPFNVSLTDAVSFLIWP